MQISHLFLPYYYSLKNTEVDIDNGDDLNYDIDDNDDNLDMIKMIMKLAMKK